MEKKEPIEFALKSLDNFSIARHNEYHYISSDFAFVNSFTGMETTPFSLDQPYRIKEGRVAFVKQGSARILINLIGHTLQPGHIAVITPNSIIQIIEVSPDLDMQMIATNHDFLPISGKDDFFSYLLHHQKNILLPLLPREQQQVKNYFTFIWGVLQEPIFHKEAIQHLLASLIYYLDISLKTALN